MEGIASEYLEETGKVTETSMEEVYSNKSKGRQGKLQRKVK